jgi:hypothetical protein
MSVRTRCSRQALRLLFAACAIAAIGLAVSPLSLAQQRDHSTVFRVLRESRDPRTRVRAALALGSSADRSVTPALVEALADPNPAVRAAVATSLGRVGDGTALTALRRLERDPSPEVRAEVARAIQRLQANTPTEAPQAAPSAPGMGVMPSVSVMPSSRDVHWPVVRYVVMLGPMQNRSTFRDATLDQVLAREVMRSLVVLRGVAVFRDGQETADAQREIRRRRLSTLRLEGSVSRIDRRPSAREVSVRSEVSLILMDHPGRNLRSMMTGAATATQPARSAARAEQERQLAEQALAGAVRSAMSDAARAIAAAGSR